MKITTSELQSNYVELYKVLRQYIWPQATVGLIVDLEMAVYTRLPDLTQVENALKRLKSAVRSTISDDEELRDRFDDFEITLEEADEVFARLFVAGGDVT